MDESVFGKKVVLTTLQLRDAPPGRLTLPLYAPDVLSGSYALNGNDLMLVGREAAPIISPSEGVIFTLFETNAYIHYTKGEIAVYIALSGGARFLPDLKIGQQVTRHTVLGYLGRPVSDRYGTHNLSIRAFPCLDRATCIREWVLRPIKAWTCSLWVGDVPSHVPNP